MTQSETGRLPPVSVIISTRNRPSMVVDVVSSVLAGDLLPDEIIVVDQSDPALLAPLGRVVAPAGCTVRHVHSDAVGLSRSNNLGAASARHDLLLFTHDDVLVAADWVRNIVSALVAAQPRTVITGRVAATAPEVAGGFAPALRDQLEPASHHGRIGFDVLKPMNFAMHRREFDEIGGFDERLGPGTAFPGAEDSDLGFRLLEAGYRIDFVPAALVLHRAWRRSEAYLPLCWNYGVAQGAFYAKHLHWRQPHMLFRMSRDVGRRVRAFPGEVRRTGWRAFGDAAFVAGNIAGACRWWRARRRSAGSSRAGRPEAKGRR